MRISAMRCPPAMPDWRAAAARDRVPSRVSTGWRCARVLDIRTRTPSQAGPVRVDVLIRAGAHPDALRRDRPLPHSTTGPAARPSTAVAAPCPVATCGCCRVSGEPPCCLSVGRQDAGVDDQPARDRIKHPCTDPRLGLRRRRAARASTVPFIRSAFPPIPSAQRESRVWWSHCCKAGSRYIVAPMRLITGSRVESGLSRRSAPSLRVTPCSIQSGTAFRGPCLLN